MPTLTLTLPELYPLQKEIVRSTAKRKVICAGRRFGKTLMLAHESTERMLRGQRVLLTSASQDQVDVFWQRIRQWVAPLNKYLYKNETRRVIRLGEGEIRVKTGSDPDALKSDYADFVVLDEAALLKPEVWFETIAPMMADRDGTAVFISTPKRKNWFYLLYNRAIADTSGRWAAWNASSHSNPHLSQVALEELTQDMTQDMYQQEIMAQFLDSGGEVFRGVLDCVYGERPQPYAGRFYAGLDWAQKDDYTAIAIVDADTRKLVDLDRFNGVSWNLQRGRVAAMYEKWKPQFILAEENSIGGPNIEALQAQGLPVRPFMTTAVSKPPLIEGLALAIERREIGLLDDGVLTGELAAYERKVGATGRSQYSAPSGLHDDTVIAVALAWHAAIEARPLFLFS